MKLQLICWQLLAMCLAWSTVHCSLVVSAKPNEGFSPKRASRISEEMAVKPTEAPLMTSSPRPTTAPRMPTTTTPRPSVIKNSPPKPPKEHHEKQHNEKDNMKAEHAAMVAKTQSALKTSSPLEHGHASQGEVSKTSTNPDPNLKPVQVTGFITRNGNIYEIENKDGIGLIEGRQNPAEEKVNICNHGSVVIYSDVPCEEVTNINVSDVKTTILKDDSDEDKESADSNQQPNVAIEEPDSNKPSDDDDDDDDKPPSRRRGQKRRRNQVNANKRRGSNAGISGNRNGNRKRNGNGNGNVNRRQTQNQRNRRNRHRQGQGQQQRRRRVNASQQQQRKRQQQNRRRQQQQEKQRRRRLQQQLIEDELLDDYDDVPQRRIPNANRRMRNGNGQRNRRAQQDARRRLEYNRSRNYIDLYEVLGY